MSCASESKQLTVMWPDPQYVFTKPYVVDKYASGTCIWLGTCTHMQYPTKRFGGGHLFQFP